MVKRVTNPKSQINGKETHRLFFCNYTGLWISHGEIKAERRVAHMHRLISKKAWSNLTLRKLYRQNAAMPPFQIENVVRP